MRKDLLFSLIDQGLLSAFNLLLSLVLIRFATPEDFGHFIYFYASVFVLISLQYALVITPLNVLLPGREEDEQRLQTSRLTTINILVVLAGVAGGLLLFVSHPEEPLVLPAVIAYFVFSMMREYGRNLHIVKGDVFRALMLDGLTVAFSILGVSMLWVPFGPVAGTIGGAAFGAWVAFIIAGPDTHLRPKDFAAHLQAYRKVWTETRWALLGAASSEAQVRSYVYLVEAWKGMSALGMVQAGRTLLSPLTLFSTAWSRIARPRMVQAIYENRDGDVVRMMVSGMVVMLGLSVAYGAAIVFAWPIIDTHIFGEKYPDMSGVILLWWVYSAVMGFNYVASAVLQSRRQFRDLAVLGGIGSTFAVLGLIGIGQTSLAVDAALYVLIGIETIELFGQLALISRGRIYRGSEVSA